ncbi:hypothetical protein MANES_10G120450v8 [Manihot esculenta]|uniref:Uncharacterized protein n=1 Tax=Manihot esculenta TaxID=3983 RepID=A0ACB7H0B0_MANES|nr:hypothetical protein MANES_10G120450v8 [Manihot esculenta]
MEAGKECEESSEAEKNSSNPYTLNSNDNPGNLITQVQLKGDNYEEWARAMRTALRAKKKMALSMDPSNNQRTMHRNSKIGEQLTPCWFSGQDGQSVVFYFGKLKILWDEINNYDQILVCACDGCKCNLTIKLKQKCEEERFHQFLMGLDEEGYGIVRFHILSTDSLPDLNRTYVMVIHKEERGNPISFAIQFSVQNLEGDKDKTCSHCNRNGHDASFSSFVLAIIYNSELPYSADVGLNPKQAADRYNLFSASCGARYLWIIVDDCSRTVWIYLVSNKSDVACVFKKFIAMVKCQFNKSVKVVKSDNDSEFVYFWDECVLTARYLINRMSSEVLHGKTPYEILFQQAPSYNHLQVFGCLCYAHNLQREKDKFASQIRRCLFVGYPFGQKGSELLGQGQQTKQISTRLKDYMTHAICISPSTCSFPPSVFSLGTPYPITHYVSYDKFSTQPRYFLGAITVGHEPNSYTEAFQDARWREAICMKI